MSRSHGLALTPMAMFGCATYTAFWLDLASPQVTADGKQEFTYLRWSVERDGRTRVPGGGCEDGFALVQ